MKNLFSLNFLSNDICTHRMIINGGRKTSTSRDLNEVQIYAQRH